MELVSRRVSTFTRTKSTFLACLLSAHLLLLAPIAAADSLLITQVAVTGAPQSVDQGQVSSAIIVQLRNAANTAETTSQPGTEVAPTSSSSTGQFFTNAGATNPITTASYTNGTANRTLYYKDTTAGSHTLTFTVSGGGVSNLSTTQQITVASISPVDTSAITFDRTSVYQPRATNAILSGDSRATAARFIVDNDNSNPIGAQTVTSSDTSRSHWKLASLPQNGAQQLRGQIQVGGIWYSSPSLLTLLAAPSLELQQSSSVQGGGSLQVYGAVQDNGGQTTVVATLMDQGGNALTSAPVAARGGTQPLASLSLSAIGSGEYIVLLTATDLDGTELGRTSVPVTIDTTVPRASNLQITPGSPIVGENFVLSASVDDTNATASVILDGGQPQAQPIASDGTLSRLYQGSLSEGTHQIVVQVTDTLGNTNMASLQPSESITFTVRSASATPPSSGGGSGSATNPTVPGIPATETPVGVTLDELTIDPVGLLSTSFSVPQTSSLVASGQKLSGVFGETGRGLVGAAGLTTDSDGTTKIVSDEKILNLKVDEPQTKDQVLAPSSGGWALFNVAWYWWAIGGVGVWVVSYGAFRILRR